MILCVAAAVLLGSPWGDPLRAHEIPADVIVRLFVAPAPGQLRVAVRVPLEAMRDVIIPTRGPGFLDMARADAALRVAAELWVANGVRMFDAGRDLGRPAMTAVRVSMPSDRSFDSADQAMALLRAAPLPETTEVLANQAFLDILLEFSPTDAHTLSLESDLARLGMRTRTIVRFRLPGQEERAFEFMGDAGRLQLDPRWHQAALRFVRSGIVHILGGVDHLLFLLCVVVPMRRVRTLVITITAFTVAHSVTLMAAAFNVFPAGDWFPPLVETLIAVSIVWMALENIVGATNVRRRWALTFVFGLVHGFGFSFGLRETLQFGGSHLVTSLLAFNVGVEIGQLATVLVMVPVLTLLFRFVVAERMGVIIISALVAHQAWHWMTERGQEFLAHELPAITATFVLRAAILVWVMGGLWLIGVRRWGGGEVGR